jgi:hypothetical protein
MPWLQVSEVKGLWLRGWTMVEGDSAALSNPSELGALRVLQMEGSLSAEQLSLSLPSLRWLRMEGAAAILPQWSLHVQVSPGPWGLCELRLACTGHWGLVCCMSTASS